jgi:hypothetical protein
MSRAIAAIGFSIAVAIVLTAATLPDRQTTGVINATAVGTTRLVEASLGQMPYKAR